MHTHTHTNPHDTHTYTHAHACSHTFDSRRILLNIAKFPPTSGKLLNGTAAGIHKKTNSRTQASALLMKDIKGDENGSTAPNS